MIPAGGFHNDRAATSLELIVQGADPGFRVCSGDKPDRILIAQSADELIFRDIDTDAERRGNGHNGGGKKIRTCMPCHIGYRGREAIPVMVAMQGVNEEERIASVVAESRGGKSLLLRSHYAR